MIELKNLTAQTIPVGGTVTFDKVILHKGCGECFSEQIPNSVRLKARGCGVVYELHFNGNITANPAGTVQLALAIDGNPLVETAMNATPAAANTLVNVSTSTLLENNCCDIGRVSVRNTGTNPVTIAPNCNFYIMRKS